MTFMNWRTRFRVNGDCQGMLAQVKAYSYGSHIHSTGWKGNLPDELAKERAGGPAWDGLWISEPDFVFVLTNPKHSGDSYKAYPHQRKRILYWGFVLLTQLKTKLSVYRIRRPSMQR